MTRKIFILLSKVVCVLGVFIGLQHLIERKTHGFYLQRILCDDLFIQPHWDTAPLSCDEEGEVKELLDQPFTFLGSGSECLAFISQDKKTVIKFFKLDHFRPIYFLRGLFSEDHSENASTVSSIYTRLSPVPCGLDPLVKRVVGMREFRIGRTFNSLKLSYDHLKEETGLIYLHLNPTCIFHKKLTLYDPNGIAQQIDIDSTRFYIQKCATPLEKHLLSLKKNQKQKRAEQCIASLCDLIVKRCRKGFADRDPYNKNFGFIEDRAIEIDTGSFIPYSRMQEPRFYKQELLFILLGIKHWAKTHYPELLAYIDSLLEEEVGREAL
jgi:hypothetical protein